MDKLNLTDKEKEEIIGKIYEGRPLPKEYIYRLFADEEDVFLFWNGRSESLINAVLPFHSIEHIDEPRKEVDESQLSLFDARGRQLTGWTNKLIWGDNKLVLSSLINGPLRDEIEKEGGLKLIYIDPPFAVGADFSYNISINGESVTKKQSVIEEIAYRDTWGRGISSYLSMMYERLKLMQELLVEEGVICVHLDEHVGYYARILLDDIFGPKAFLNEIVWYYPDNFQGNVNRFANNHNYILVYSKSENVKLDRVSIPLKEPVKRDKRVWDKIQGKIVAARDKNGNIIYEEFTTKFADDVWTIGQSSVSKSHSKEYLGYPTQKPEEILRRIILASSNEGDLVADFFCGSGTTAAVAEKLGRKWIACDLGRFAIHTTRKRLIEVQRQLKKEGKPYRSFEVLNLGKYERQFFFGIPPDLSPDQQERFLQIKQEKYIQLILEGYRAQTVEGYALLHGKKAGRMVHVGPLNVPVTKTLIEDVFEECRRNLISQVDVLGFEFEMGLVPYIKDELREQGVDLRLRYIPKEVFDKRAVEKGQVKFYDVAY